MISKNRLNGAAVKFVLPALLASILFGCSMWKDFTTYFNTYYNAETIFEEAENEILLVPKPLFGFKEDKVSSKVKESLEKVIEKCSKIMQYETESSFFPNALFMTGKAFYYQQNYSKALRKFNELAGLENEELSLDTDLWIGKCQFQVRDYKNAYDLLNEVKDKAVELEREDIFTDAFKRQISYLIYEKEYLTAINQCEKFVEATESDQLKAEILYEMGKLYLELDDPEKAAEAFSVVNDYSPTFDIEFSSKFQYAQIKKNEGYIDESLELFQELKDENKFADSLGLVELEFADVYYRNGDIEKAYDHYTMIDTTYIEDKSGGIAVFKRAEIFEEDFMEYDSALIFYGYTMDSKAPKDCKDIAKEKIRLLDKHGLFHQKIKEHLRLISYIDDPGLFVQDSITYEDYLERRKARQDSIENAQQNSTTPRAGIDKKRDAKNKDRGRSTIREESKEKVLYPPPKPTITKDSLQKLIIENQYDLGNLFYTDLNVPDSAYYYYNKILTDFPDNHYYAKALYAIGTYYLTLENETKADSIFQVVYDNYRNDEVYVEAARQLGKITSDDEADPAYVLYTNAEKNFYESEIDSSVAGYLKIYNDYPESKLVPKALFAAGYILEHDLQMPDSAAVVYDVLLTEFADSHYSTQIASKLRFYKQEKTKAEQDEVIEQKPVEEETGGDPEKSEGEAGIVQKDNVVPIDSVNKIIKKKPVLPDSTVLKKLKSFAEKETKPKVQRDSTFIEE